MAGTERLTPKGERTRARIVATAARLMHVGGVAETDLTARGQIAGGFGRWSDALRDGLRDLAAAGQLRPGLDPDDVAVTLLATLQGGLLLAQVQRETGALATALDTMLALVLVA